ncbi:MAG: helicase-associated domain-containing protein [Planctomycetes bacterium]|nr:helicase-associated domain-containing protein [Planctomycetota bacterium]
MPKTRGATISTVAAAMEDEQGALQRIAGLPRKLQDLLENFLGNGGAVRAVHELQQETAETFKSRFELEATLAALHREGFLWPANDPRWASYDSPCWGMPGELVECVLNYRRRSERRLQDSLTLQGFLDARYFRERLKPTPASGNGKAQSKAAAGKAAGGNGKAADRAADHARKIFKLYTMPSSMAQRLGKLPGAVKALVDHALTRHGGVATWSELVQECDLASPPDPEFVGKALEEAMLGTVGTLELARIGIQPMEQSVVVFHEVALHAIRDRARVEIPEVDDALVCGGNFATNVGRFLRELQDSKVLFTADGELFKASQKRIAGLLLPVPGGFLPAEGLLETVYRFCLHRRLIDRRGERSLRPTAAGKQFDRDALADQTRMLLSHFVEDRTLPGDAFHQVRLRRVLLRLLRRAEPMVWQEVAALPFLTRGIYLTQLDIKQAEEFFATRFQGGGYMPTETLQQICWNLLIWVKKRLFPLGIVDLGMQAGRLVAMRLSQLGAELLDAEPATKVGGTRSTLIVQPDFEVLVFAGDDVHDVVHLFDRFSRRIKSDHVHQFKLEQATVARGIDDGLVLGDILRELTDRARAPIPQNVLYSLEEWGQKKSS